MRQSRCSCGPPAGPDHEAEAEHGAQALEQWQDLAPALVLRDLRMPVLDGFAAIKLLRPRVAAHGLPPTPVVAISASVDWCNG